MLFNSYTFIFLFLPIVLIGFHWIGAQGRHRVAITWLVAASLFFYGWWNPVYLGLILGSMLFNYALAVMMLTQKKEKIKSYYLFAGVVVNLVLLGYYKYANFFVDNFNMLTGVDYNLEIIILPLAISFFTFQQIAYLVDVKRGEAKEHQFLHYALFVTFFPQLIAGPIVHHKEMLPQFARNDLYHLRTRHLAVGITIFTIGLFKKVVLADGVSIHANSVFDAAEAGVVLTLFEAWGGALAYTLQLYFDFSGYSDMAIGIARMFGVRLPINFNSPYKATSIIDFWRRWHITLSRFLREYLYFSLGGNRRGEVRRMVNLMVTMLLGGLWHGAGWTFVLWGGLHGAYIVANHLWIKVRVKFMDGSSTALGSSLGWLLTMLAVVVAWVPFRAESMDGASVILGAMMGMNGISLPSAFSEYSNSYMPWLVDYGVVFQGMFHNGAIGDPIAAFVLIAVMSIIAIFFPNTQEWMRRYYPAYTASHDKISPFSWRFLEWRLTTGWATLTALLFVMGVLGLMRISEFLYFQF